VQKLLSELEGKDINEVGCSCRDDAQHRLVAWGVLAGARQLRPMQLSRASRRGANRALGSDGRWGAAQHSASAWSASSSGETRLSLLSRQSTLVKLREAASSVPLARCTPL
jgi:hypothetical protein